MNKMETKMEEMLAIFCISESFISIPNPEYRIAEDIGELMIPIKRAGDLMDEFMVVCCTKSGKKSCTSFLQSAEFI